jgi:hypothetical protein
MPHCGPSHLSLLSCINTKVGIARLQARLSNKLSRLGDPSGIDQHNADFRAVESGKYTHTGQGARCSLNSRMANISLELRGLLSLHVK